MTTMSDILISQGISQGKYETIMSCYYDKAIDKNYAAMQLAITLEEFQKEYEKWLEKREKNTLET